MEANCPKKNQGKIVSKKIMKYFVFKKSIYMWKKFPVLVYFYNLVIAKFWLLRKSETT